MQSLFWAAVVLTAASLKNVQVNAADAFDVCTAGLTSQENPFTESDRSLTIFLDLKFKCDGALTNVEYFSERSDGTVFYVDVWRAGSGENQYILVGSIRLTSVSYGRQSVDIDVEKRFRVQQGDMLGIHYEGGGDGVVIPYFTPQRPGPFSQEQYSDIVTLGYYHRQILTTLQSNQFISILPIQPRARIPGLVATVSPGKVLFSCNFTNSLCGMEPTPDPVGFRWTTSQAYRVRLSPEQTAIDNTEKSSLGYLAFTTSAANVRSGTTLLTRTGLTCPSSATNECCLSFYVILYGTALVNVKIRRQSDQLPETLGVVVGQTYGNMWPQIYKTFSSPGTFDLIFEAERGTQGDSSAALDDIVLSEGKCPTIDDSAATCGNYSCSFDDSKCGFSTPTSQQSSFEWSWQTGPSPNRPSNTGPNAGLLDRGAYLLASSYGRLPNDRARIASRPLAISCLRSRVVCYTVSFYFHMYGPRQGRLNVFANFASQEKLLWTTAGDHGDGWIYIETEQQPITDVPFNAQSIRIIFEANIGGSQFSDIAVDQVQVNFQSCKSVETACTAGPESIASPPRQLTRPTNVLSICDSVNFPCGGRVRAWEVYATYAPATIFAAAFRPIAGGNRYRQVGFNVIKLSSAGQQSIKIDDPDQFVVQPGDVMGFYYDSRFTRGILAFDNSTAVQSSQCWEAPIWKADVDQLMASETFIDMSAVDGSIAKRKHFIKAYVLGTQSCGVVPEVHNAVAQPSFNGRTSVVGDAVVYSCLPGFNMEGPTTVTCTFAATWSELPVCVATPICEAGPANIAPAAVFFTPAERATHLHICATNFVRCSGLISAWQFYSIRNDNSTVFLTVWRKLFGTNYQLIGKTAAKALRVGRVLVELPSNDERIPVQEGDVLGIMYEFTSSPAVISIATESSLMGFNRNDLHQCYVQALFDGDVRNRMTIDGSVHVDEKLERRIIALKAAIDSGNRCQPAPTLPNTVIQSRSFPETESAQVGDKVVYACARGYTMIGGDTITCLSSGRWTAPPQCRALPACIVGPENVSPDPSTLGDPGTALMLCTTTRITCPGVIQEWQYYALYGTGAAVYLSIWRKLSETKFQLVGSNMVRPSQVGRMTYEVPDFDQITVQPGDIIGVFYEVESQSGEIAYANEAYPGGLPMSTFNNQQCLLASLYKNDMYRQMAANSYVSIQPDRIDARIAALNAVVRSIGTCGPAPSVLNANVDASFDSFQSAPGDYVVYTCAPGFVMSGNATSRCNLSGRWTELPVCAELPRCTLGSYNIPELPTGLARPGNWLNICVRQSLTCSGQISRWQLLSLGEAIVYASVWRRVGDNEYALVGYNRLNVSRAGQMTVFVEPEDRIYVRPGDLLGVFYDDPEAVGAIPYADPQNLGNVPLSNLDQCMSSPLYLPEVTHQMSVSRYVRFSAGTNPFARRFMLKAFVKDDQGCGPVPSVPNAQSEHQIWNRTSQFGDVAIFHCVVGYSMVGNAAVTCSQTEGRWTDAPKCIEKPLCSVGVKQFPQALNNGDLSTSFIMCPSLQFTCAGEIAEWEIFSVRDDGAIAYVSVWRKATSGYQLVGYNRLTASRTGILRQAIRPSERIQVQASDFIAIFYDDQTVPAIIPYATDDNLAGFTRNSLMDCNMASVYQAELLPFALPNTRAFKVSGQLSRRLPAVRGLVYGTGGCGPIPTIENGQVYMSTSSNENQSVVNDYAKFQCHSGFVLYGPEIVSCLASGRWSALPVCLSPEACMAGTRTIRAPSQGLVMDKNQMALCPAAIFRCPGVIDVWEFYNVLGGANTVYLSVWRRRSMNEFVLIGSHLVTSVDPGHNLFIPPTKERIVVESGDFIGFFYELESSAGLMTYADATHLGGASPVELMSDCIIAPLYKAQIYQQMSIRGSVLIDDPVKSNRLYSLRAYVKSESVCGSIPHVDYATSLYPVAGRPIRVNDTVEYSCDVNRFLIGQANITCTADNGWTQEPACVEAPTCFAGSNLNPIRSDDFSNNSTTTNLTICPTEMFSCLGDVFGWEVYSLVDDNSPIFVGVFRPGVDNDNKTFEVVGYMRGSASRVGRIFIESSSTISTRKPIRVRPGDFIGVFYDYRWSVPTVATVNPIEPVNISACPVNKASTTTTMYPVILPETTTIDWMQLRSSNSSAIPRPCSINETHVRAGSEIISREDFDTLVQELEERFTGDNLVNCMTAQVYRSTIDNVLSSGINSLLSIPQGVQTRRLLRVRAFVKGVPSCPKPPTIRSGVLVPSYTRSAAEPGDTVVLRCSSGLRIRGNPVIQCQANGKWSSPLPSCEPVPTPPPRCSRSALPNDSQIPKLLVMPMFIGSTAEPGDAAEFACADSYFLIGPSNTTCQNNGAWSEAPTCSPTKPPTTCVEPPPVVEYAVVVETSLDNPNRLKPDNVAGLEGDSVVYRCRPGYTLRGNATITCLPTSAWSKAPVCTVETGSCGDVPSVANARPLPSFYFRPSRIGDVVYYSCFTGFRITGNATITCQNTKLWSPLPNCQPVEVRPCGDPPQLRNGFVTSMSYPSSRGGGALVNDSVEYKCARNFQLLGNNRVACQADGTWSELPNCGPLPVRPPQPINGASGPIRNSCGAPPTTPNAILTPSFSGSASVIGDSVTFDCRPGYTLVGSASIYCTVDLAWSDRPSCRLIVARTKRSARDDSPTTPNTPWQIPPAHNAIMTCGYPPVVENAEPTASYTTDARTLGRSAPFDTVVYRCLKGHLVGTAVIYCREDGSWSSRPSCVVKKPVGRQRASPSSAPGVTAAAAGGDSKTCGSHPHVENALARPSFTGTGSTIGDSVVYQCVNGYILEGYPVVYCLDSNWWSPQPSCREIPRRPGLPLPPPVEGMSRFPPVPPAASTDPDRFPAHPHPHGPYPGYGPWAPVPFMPVVSFMAPPLTIGCGLPPARPRTVLLTPAKTCLPGDAALYSCDYGYQMIGEPMIQCQCSEPAEGRCQWVPTAPICHPAEDIAGTTKVPVTSTTSTTTQSAEMCNYIPQIENGRCNVSSGLDYAFVGEKANCVCDDGFYLAGAREIYCQRNKEWTPPPICLVTTTTSTTTTTTTTTPNVTDSTTPVSTTTTAAPQGCLPTPICQQTYVPCCGAAMPRTCGPAPFIPGAICLTPFTQQTTPIGTQASYYCQGSGQVVSSVCQPAQTGCQWTTPSCPNAQASQMAPSAQMMLAPGQASQAYMQHYQHPMYHGAGRKRRDAQTAMAKLSSKLTSNVSCGLPPKVHFAVGVLSWGGRPSRPKDSVVFRCIRGELRGPIAAFCREDGRWTHAPTCSVELSSHGSSSTSASTTPAVSVSAAKGRAAAKQANPGANFGNACRDPPTVENAYSLPSFTGGRAEAGDRVVYSCMSGSTIEGNSVVVCQADGTWTDPPRCLNTTNENGNNNNAPVARGESCGPAPFTNNAQIFPSWSSNQRDSRTGDSVTYRCDDGFTRQGYVTIYCLANGAWPDPPACVPNEEARGTGAAPAVPPRPRASCGSPPTVPNAIAIPSFNRGFSQEGDTVTYQCQNNFNLRGAATIYCSVLSQWSSPPNCDPPAVTPAPTIGSCGPAPRVPHASHQTSFGSQQSSVGDTAAYTCDDGYILEGPDTIFCVARGFWSTLPACRENPNARVAPAAAAPRPAAAPITCPEPPFLVDGNYFKSFTGEATSGAVVYYRCNSGFTMVGSDQSICTDTGVWRSVNGAPFCARSPATPSPPPATTPNGPGITGCFPPPQVNNAQAIRYYTDEPPRPGAYVVYECDTGFQISGTPSVVCQEDLRWTSPPRCLSATPSSTTCGEPFQIPNARADKFYSGPRSQPGDYVAYDCSTGYELQGVPTSVCQESGEWSRPPICILSTCGAGPAIVNGIATSQTFVGEGSRIGDSVRYQCVDGYRFADGSGAQVTCQRNGEWSSAPNCIANPPPTTTPTTTSSTATTTTSTTSTTPMTTSTTTTPQTCGQAPTVGDAVIVPLYTGPQSRIGDSVSYQCRSPNYQMIGYPVAYCLSNGKWSPTPTCQWLPPSVPLPPPPPPPPIAILPPPPPAVLPQRRPPPPISLTCPMPPSVQNGNILPTKQANFVTYKCFDGFRLQGTPFAVCECTTQDGRCMWTPAPTCELAPTVVANTSSSSTVTTASTTSAPPPTCGPAPMIAFGLCRIVSPDFDDSSMAVLGNASTTTSRTPLTTISAQLAQKGDRAHCQCFSSYDLQGPPNVYCQSDLTWSISPKCISQIAARAYRVSTSSTTTVAPSTTTKKVGCGPAPTIQFGYIATQALTIKSHFGAVASYVCQPGFQLSGPTLVSYCLHSGVWSTPPTCCNPMIPVLPCSATTTTASTTTPTTTTTTTASTTTTATTTTSSDTTTMIQNLVGPDVGGGTRSPCSKTTTPGVGCKSRVTTTASGDQNPNPAFPPVDQPSTTPDPFGSDVFMVMATNEPGEDCINGPCRFNLNNPTRWKTIFPLAWFSVTTRSTSPAPHPSFLPRKASSSAEYGPKPNANSNPAGYCCGRPPAVNYATPVDLEPILNDDFVVKTIASHIHGLTRADHATQRRLHSLLSTSRVAERSRKTGPKIYCVADSISYICDEGMELTGPAIVSCMANGRWSLLPTCQPLSPNNYDQTRAGFSDVDMLLRNDHPQNDDRTPSRDSCGALPPSVPNGAVIDQSFKDRFSRIGDTATYDCESGYRMVGYKTVFCLSHEKWSPLPVCERDLPLCSAEPPHVPHAKATVVRSAENAKEDKNATKVGDKATYECDPGFVLDGHPVSYCLANGEWTPPPDCDELACPEPVLEKGSAAYESLAIGSTAFFSCDDDYNLEGPTTASCTINATWTSFPKCIGPFRCRWGSKIQGIDKNAEDVATKTNSQRIPPVSLAIFTMLPIQCSGMIKKWNLWNSAAGSVVIYADIWRFSNASNAAPLNNDYEEQLNDPIGDQYILIGSNRLVVDAPGAQSLQVEAGLQIFVQSGDLIGIRYDRISTPQNQAGAIALMPAAGQQVLVTSSYPSTLMINTGYSFAATATFKSGIPLLSAVVEDTQELPYGPCVVNKTRCPANAECMARSCAGYGCVCSEGYWPNGNRTKCLKAVHLGEACKSDDVTCIGYNVQCSTETGLCACWDDWVPASDNIRCVRRSASTAKPQALLNETCSLDSSQSCYFGRFDQECSKVSDDEEEYRCRCRSGYRPASASERRAFPDDGFECRPDGYDLNSNGGDCSNDEGTSGALTGSSEGFQEKVRHIVHANSSLIMVLGLLSCIAVVGSVVVIVFVKQQRSLESSHDLRTFRVAPPVVAYATVRPKQHPIVMIGPHQQDVTSSPTSASNHPSRGVQY